MLTRFFYIYKGPTLALLFIAVLSLTLCAPLFGAAQTTQGLDPLEIQVVPEAPGPGDETRITVNSFSIDFDRAELRWTLNGNPAQAGTGLRTFTFVMGPAGRETVVGLSVIPSRGSSITRTFRFRPASATLLWEAETFTPPLYRGQALYSPGSSVRVLAIPTVIETSGAAISASNLIYKWEVDGEAVGSQSGPGRDLLLLTGSQLRQSENVRVVITRQDGSQAAQASVNILATQPLVRFYKADPLRGIRYERALGESMTLTETETTLVAAPYFSGIKSRNSENLTYTWLLNGRKVEPSGIDPSVITLRNSGAVEGAASLEFAVQNTSYGKLLQGARGIISLVFSDNN